MTSPRMILGAVALVVALIVPSSASAFQWTFRTFDLGGGTTGNVTAKKCKGGQFGYYDYHGVLSGPSLTHTVDAQMPAFAKFKDFKDVKLTVSGPAADGVPPDILNQIIAAFTSFYEETTTKYNAKKGKLTFNHPALSLFGSQVIPAETSTLKFKPKPGC